MGEGFLRRYEREMSKYTDAPEQFHRASAYAIYGALLSRSGNRLRIAAGPEPLWPNLWMVLCGGSAQSRKSTSIHFAQSVALTIDKQIIAPDSFTPEGFASYLFQRQNDRQTVNGGPAALLTLTEMSQFLLETQRQYAAANKSMLMSMYDVKTFRRQLSKSTLEVKLPRVSLLGGIAPELLASHTDTADWQGGFMSRTMLIHGVRNRVLEDPVPVPDDVFRELGRSMLDRLNTQMRTRKKNKKAWVDKGFTNFVFDFEDSARKVWAKTPSSHRDPALNFTLGRSKAHLAKMAAIEQVDLDPTSPVITEAAVRKARELWQAWWDDSPRLVTSCFSRSQADLGGDRLALRIYRVLIDSSEPVDIRLVMRSTAINANAFNAAIDSLQQAGMIRVDVMKDESGEDLQKLSAIDRSGDGETLLALSRSAPADVRRKGVN